MLARAYPRSKGGAAMGNTLSIIAVVVLLVLLIVNTKRWREGQAAKTQVIARAHTGDAEAQHAESLHRRAGVGAAHAERAGANASDANDAEVSPRRAQRDPTH